MVSPRCSKDLKSGWECAVPLLRGVGVCPLRQDFTLLHGAEHTPATAQSGAPPLRGEQKHSSEHLFVFSPANLRV